MTIEHLEHPGITLLQRAQRPWRFLKDCGEHEETQRPPSKAKPGSTHSVQSASPEPEQCKQVEWQDMHEAVLLLRKVLLGHVLTHLPSGVSNKLSPQAVHTEALVQFPPTPHADSHERHTDWLLLLSP